MGPIGKYRIVKEIGRGSMGIVYLGHDPFRDIPVALKVSRPSKRERPHEAGMYRRLFFNEMRAAGILHHTNIVRVYDAGVHGESYYIAMEYVPGALTLEAYCRPARLLPVEAVADIVLQCAEALDYAHRQGVIHRDIKPSNVLLGHNRAVKVSDFSVALLTDPALAETQLTRTAGSPLYMSPEQLRENPLNSQSDLFSLGVVFYELLSGHHPFPAETMASLTQRVLHEEPPPIRTLRPEVTESLERVLSKTLAKNLDRRYRTATDLAADLSRCFSELHFNQKGIDTQGRAAALRALSFFEGFDDAEIWELLRWALWEEVAAGETLIAEGEQDDSIYILIRGEVAVVKRSKPVARLKAGECFGEIAYLARRQRTATITALTGVSVLKINAHSIEQASLNCRVQFQKVFIRTLIQRLVQTTERLARGD